MASWSWAEDEGAPGRPDRTGVIDVVPTYVGLLCGARKARRGEVPLSRRRREEVEARLGVRGKMG